MSIHNGKFSFCLFKLLTHLYKYWIYWIMLNLVYSNKNFSVSVESGNYSHIWMKKIIFHVFTYYNTYSNTPCLREINYFTYEYIRLEGECLLWTQIPNAGDKRNAFFIVFIIRKPHSIYEQNHINYILFQKKSIRNLWLLDGPGMCYKWNAVFVRWNLYIVSPSWARYLCLFVATFLLIN